MWTVVIAAIIGAVLLAGVDRDRFAGGFMGLLFGGMIGIFIAIFIGLTFSSETEVVTKTQLEALHGSGTCATYINTNSPDENSQNRYTYKYIDENGNEIYDFVKNYETTIHYEDRKNAVLVTVFTDRDAGRWGFVKDDTEYKIILPICGK